MAGFDQLAPDAFRWVPGEGPTLAAIGNLRRRFPSHPAEPPGEAWLMSDNRRFFTEFIDEKVDRVPVSVIDDFLFDMIFGLNSFADLLSEVENWSAWFKYLMPELIERAHEHDVFYLLESLISGFMRVFGDTPEVTDETLRIDALDTIGKALMQPAFWCEGRELIALDFQGWITCTGEPKEKPSCSGALSSSLFFCLMYLPPDCLRTWTQSILEIPSPHFKAHFLVWLTATYELFKEKTFSFRALHFTRFPIDWQPSFFLEDSEPRISADSINQFLASIKQNLNRKTVLSWLDDISAMPELDFLIKHYSIGEYVCDVILADECTQTANSY